MIKLRFYHNNCININDKILIKNLRIIKGIDLKDILFIDNSMHSFSSQLANGILPLIHDIFNQIYFKISNFNLYFYIYSKSQMILFE